MSEEKIAICVPCEELSEVVQRKLFDMEYAWDDGKQMKSDLFNVFVKKEAVIIYLEQDKTLEWDALSDRDNDYTILTVDEFFAREAEKEIEVKQMIGGREVIAGVIGVDIANKIKLTWREFDEINKLRPTNITGGSSCWRR